MKTRTRKRPANMEVMAGMCSSCPFRTDSPLAFLAADLTASALTECSRECHSTGGNTLVHPLSKTRVKAKLCRGARDAQLKMFHQMGFLSEPSDAAWAERCKQLGLT